MVTKDEFKKIVDGVADALGIDLVPIEYGNIEDDSRLVLKPEQKIIINEKYENDFLETVKCLTHEMRHIFQIYAVKIIDNELTRVWKEELTQGEYSTKNNENSVECDDYSMRSIELDAYAFSQYYLSKYGVIFKYKNALYQKLVEQYIDKYLVE